jgi:hypothetical protein
VEPAAQTIRGGGVALLRALIRLLRRGVIDADPSQLTLPLSDRRVEPRPGTERPLAPTQATPARRPRIRPTPAQADAAASAKLVRYHAEYNTTRFGGRLKPIAIIVSRRLRSRLGYYRVATTDEPGLIVISRRHLRRHGWAEVLETLLHEMVHQWQDESHLPVDHGAGFRAQALAVGVHPRARRPVEQSPPDFGSGLGPSASAGATSQRAARRDGPRPGR